MKSHQTSSPLLVTVVSLGLLLLNSGCSKKLSEEDYAAARKAMPMKEVVFKIKGGVPKEEVLAELLRRKTPTKVVPATELELSAFGAGARLLAALKDDNNILTPDQERAYGELAAAKLGANNPPPTLWARIVSFVTGQTPEATAPAAAPAVSRLADQRSPLEIEQEREAKRKQDLDASYQRALDNARQAEAAQQRQLATNPPNFSTTQPVQPRR